MSLAVPYLTHFAAQAHVKRDLERLGTTDISCWPWTMNHKATVVKSLMIFHQENQRASMS